MSDWVPRCGYVLCDVEMADLIRNKIHRHNDRMYQAAMNNLWDNHPGEMDRWADDGGMAAP